MIPHLIHQTAKTADIPEQWRGFQSRVQQLHPSWRYKLWTDTDNLALVQADFPQYLDMYQNLPRNIMRADVIRYMLMYRFGGMYLDLDYEFLKPFDLDHKNLVLPRESDDSAQLFVGNAVFASEPGHSFWLAALDDVTRQNLTPDQHVLEDEIINMTGPGLLTRVYNGSFAQDSGIHIPGKLAFNPTIPQSPQEHDVLQKSGVSYGIHHCTGSWRALTLWQRLLHKIARFFGIVIK